ncbi:MAG: TIGR03016 family PEP-CTERM system-associated outer membrane protein [Rubrivivax sp.]|nr:TIGR03016 family PEP-CTERM system-associated outer membrane protein [Rubrivivax sp.]
MVAHPRKRPAPRSAAWLFAALAWPAAHAQDAVGSGLTIAPTLTLKETLTSNRDLSSSDPQADAITQVSPGIRISSRAGRVQGSLAYSLNALAYARASQLNTLQHSLSADATAEVVEKHAFINARATVSQQAISAFGTQGADGTGLNDSNRTEVATVSVSPTLRGNLGGWADFNAGANWTSSSSASTDLGDNSSYSGQVGLRGRSGPFGWGLNASRQVSDFNLGRTSTTDQMGGTLTYVPQYDLQVSLRLGRSGSDVLTGSRVWQTTSGGGVSWQPTDRTQIALQSDRTYYGRSHSYSFRHRMARSVWSYTDTESVSTPSAQSSVQPLTLYDLLYNICLASGGDAAGCDTAVRDALAQQGLDPNAVVAGGFLNSSITQSRSQNLAVSYAALRTTFTVSVFRTTTSALGQVEPVSGDLAQGVPVRQVGATLGASHRLAPGTSLTLTATQRKTLDSGAQLGNQQRTVTLGYSMSPGPRSSLTLTARHTQFESTTNPYHESALIASLGLRF